MRAPDAVRFGIDVQQLACVLADSLEHAEALAVSAHEALVDERAKGVEIPAAHLLDRLERAAADEDGETAKSALSSSSRSSTLQPIVSRSAWCREGASRDPEVRSSSR